MVIATLTVLSGRTVCESQNAAWRRPMKNELKHHEQVVQIRTAWNLVVNGVACGHEVCENRLDRSAVHPVCVKARPSIVRRQSEL